MNQPPLEIAEHYLRMPPVENGMAVGLFGGSFNPPHEGHVIVANTALKRLKLDQLWWMVTPGNPLKDHSRLAPLADRIRLSEELANDPYIKVTAFEAAHEIRYTADTIALVLAQHPKVNFVWIMGADSLNSFHEWERWCSIVENMPIAVLDRPGSTLSHHSSTMARLFNAAQIDEKDASKLARMTPPAWTFIHGPRSPLSSTTLRNQAERSHKN